MTNNNDTIWTWLQPRGRIYKVISNKEAGTIRVYDDTGAMIMERKNLSKKQIEIVETNFLKPVAKRLTPAEPKLQNDHYDPMIA